MGFQIKNDVNEVLLHEIYDDWTSKLVSPSLVEEKMDMVYEFGQARLKEVYFDGYHFATGNAEIYQNLHIETTDQAKAVSLIFMVHGQFAANVVGEPPHRFTSLEHNLFYNPSQEENLDIIKQRGLTMVGLTFSKERFLELAVNNGRVLDGLADRIAGDKPITLNRKSNHPITTRILMVLDEIRNCHFIGGHKKLFLQSKAIELLALQCEQQEQAQDSRKQTFVLSAADRERIHYARELILSNLQTPLSLSELSRAAGLNEFKLKNGFKLVFENTVFGYLNDHKMEHARRLLHQPHYSMTCIAEELGFSSVQHFSTAFRKKFGVSPMKMKKG